MFINFLKTIFLVDLLKGMWVTFKYTFTKKVTIQYPEQVKEPRERFRGILRLQRNEQNEPLCIACKMCEKSCPESCFSIEGIRNDAGKLKPAKFDWKMQRCSFCGICVEVCPTDALRFSKEFRMATLDKEKYNFTIDKMYPDFDIQKYFLGDK